MNTPRSGRSTRSQTKSEVRFSNDRTHPLSPESSNTGSTSLSPASSHKKSLIVKLPYRNSDAASESLDRSNSKSAIMDAPATLIESPQISDEEHIQQTMQYQTSPQTFATHNANYYGPPPVNQLKFQPELFMHPSAPQMFDSYNRNGAQITQQAGMGYGYRMDNGGPVQHTGFRHFQAQPSSGPPLWNPTQSYASQPPSAVNSQGPPYGGRRYIGSIHGAVSRQAFFHGSQSMNNSHGPDIHASSSMINGAAALNHGPMMLNQYHSSSPMSAPDQGAQMPVSYIKYAPGLCSITRAEADLRSVPSPGDELTHLVEEAKIRKEVAKYHSTALVRYVDGYWMVPQPCTSCKNNNKASQCDRNVPCKACSKTKVECTSDNFMVVLRKAGKNPISLAAQPGTVLPRLEPKDMGESPISLLAASETVNLTHVEPKKRKRGSGRNAPTYVVPVLDDDHEFTASDNDDHYHSGKARKLRDDEDFNPGGRQSSPDFKGSPAKLNRSSSTKSRAPQGSTESKTPIKPKKVKPDPKYHINVQETYPDPVGKPLVWANQRQPLCETLPYYRAYESAAYTSDGILYGFLIDREVGLRDQFTDQIVISKCGGGKSQDENGKMVQTKNQETSAISAAFERAMKEHLPVAVIAGQGNSASPTKLPHYYNVLDWFHVTYVWCEVVDGVVCYMARLEKINLREMSWWAPKETALSEPDFNSPKAERKPCTACNVESKVIFQQGFACLNPQCSKYFEFSMPVDHTELKYSEVFLSERTQYSGPEPGPILPPLPELEGEDFGYEERYRKGIVCSKCQCCSRRLEWRRWECENTDMSCSFTHSVIQRPISVVDAIRQGNDADGDKVRVSRFICHASIKVKTASTKFYDICEYAIPNHENKSIGFVRHFKPRKVVNELPDGPNDLFMQLQTEDFGLQRNASRLAGHVKEVSTSHWALNFGAPYKYSVVTKSKSFAEAPLVILKALKRLTWAGEYALTTNKELFKPFNELLTVGYFEHSHIGFHDDGEKELGPTVATLSLGASATMDFRPKAKGPVGEFRGPNQSNSKGKKKKPVMLSITLDHGDLIVMHGQEIQKYYEHAVKPHGKLRYALTSRYVDPTLMESDDDRKFAAIAGALPLGHEKYDYDGDETLDIHTQAAVQQRTVNHLAALREHTRANVLAGNITQAQLRALAKELLADLPEEPSDAVSNTTGSAMNTQPADAEACLVEAQAIPEDTQME